MITILPQQNHVFWRIFMLSFVLLFLVSCVPEVVKYNQEGNERFNQTSYGQALDAYRLAQVSDPEVPEPYYNAANTYNRQGDITGTELQTEQALRSPDPELQAQAWYNLGNAYFDGQGWEQAIEAYRSALRLNPQDEDAKYNLELALQAMQQQSEEQSEEQSEKQSEEQNDGQQQDQNTGSQEQDQKPENDQSEPEQDGAEQASPESEEENLPDERTEATDQAMTPEQAQQLLEALLSDSETLQEHLQQRFVAPGAPPEEDW
ncbi:MAG: tetratricopeptide repeat protein [Anaerolineae bacterium]|nr:tetratricopeptide repeat protein [Anaerolineae bacterium]